ncbi:MAG: Hsp20/alpha crystallin family protein [Sphingomonadales bacterium]|jgi:HSP20 family protein
MSTLATTTARMFPAFTSLWEDLLNKDLLEWDGDLTASTPSVNVRETDKDFRIELAAPGMKKDDFNIELQNNVLTISTEKKEQKEEKLEGKFLRREYSYRAFQRSFALPENCERDSIKATYTDGILNISLNKKYVEATTTSMKIQVK